MSIPGFSQEFFTRDGIKISYEISGEGPPVLLLHGYPQNKTMWMKVAPLLARYYTVVCADLRGYGRSSKPQCLSDHSNYSFRIFAHDQMGLMHHLGFEKFHVVGHDRGGRTAHRLTLDHPDAVKSLTVMDIVPTYAMFHDSNYKIAGAYWHWYFLQQPTPFPERLIGNDPDFFYETCLIGWGSSTLSDFDPVMLHSYRQDWRNPEMIHGSCSDYRAAATIDLEHDAYDLERQIHVPTLVLYGESGAMNKFYDIPAEWRKRCVNVQSAAMPGGHFFVDQYPEETALHLLGFLQA
jgi:haloacetate dehalogenase